MARRNLETSFSDLYKIQEIGPNKKKEKLKISPNKVPRAKFKMQAREEHDSQTTVRLV